MLPIRSSGTAGEQKPLGRPGSVAKSRSGHRSYAARVSDSPLSPQQIRAAAAACAERGPEHSGAVAWAAAAGRAGRHRGGRAPVRMGPRVGQE
jgi:hypothetical protein